MSICISLGNEVEEDEDQIYVKCFRDDYDKLIFEGKLKENNYGRLPEEEAKSFHFSGLNTKWFSDRISKEFYEETRNKVKVWETKDFPHSLKRVGIPLEVIKKYKYIGVS